MSLSIWRSATTVRKAAIEHADADESEGQTCERGRPCGDCAICEEARADEAGDMKRRERKEREWWGDEGTDFPEDRDFEPARFYAEE